MTSRRILVCGVGPLPREAGDKLVAPGLRLETLALKLAEAGHEVSVWRFDFDLITAKNHTNNSHIPERDDNYGYPFKILEISDLTGSSGEAGFLKHLNEADRFYDAIYSLTDFISSFVCRAAPRIPVHVDLFGDPIVERQLQGWAANNDAALGEVVPAMIPILLGADRFSVCSRAHYHALHGQLGLLGRQNKHTALVDIVSEWRPGWSMEFPSPPADKAPVKLRGNLVPENAFVLLWSGGYNNWADIDGLFVALETAMERVPNLYYVSTGGTIKGHADRPFTRLKELINKSPRKERFIFTGWLETWEMPGLYKQADAAINFDLPVLEGELGTRNRLLDWAHFGTPVITTPGSELARAMIESCAAEEIPFERPAARAEIVGKLNESKTEQNELSARGQKFAQNWMVTAFPKLMLEWAADPQAAPDLPAPAERHARITPDNPASTLFRELFLEDGITQLREDRGSRLYNFYRKLKKKK